MLPGSPTLAGFSLTAWLLWPDKSLLTFVDKGVSLNQAYKRDHNDHNEDIRKFVKFCKVVLFLKTSSNMICDILN